MLMMTYFLSVYVRYVIFLSLKVCNNDNIDIVEK